jgi:hypothetical protein
LGIIQGADFYAACGNASIYNSSRSYKIRLQWGLGSSYNGMQPHYKSTDPNDLDNWKRCVNNAVNRYAIWASKNKYFGVEGIGEIDQIFVSLCDHLDKIS